MAFSTSRRSVVRGAPAGTGGGSRGSTRAHSSFLRSLGYGLRGSASMRRFSIKAHMAAFADAGRSEKHQKMQMTGGESADVGFQLGVGFQAEGVWRRLDGCGHGWNLNVSAREGMPMAGDAGPSDVTRPSLKVHWVTSSRRRARRSGLSRF